MLRSASPFVQSRLSPRLRLAAGLGAIGLAVLTPAAARALVVDCADGSVVLSSRWEDVHCVGAVEVEPGATPRLGAARQLHVPDRREARRRRETQREFDLESQIDRARMAFGRQRPSLAPNRPTPFVLSGSEYDALSRMLEKRQEARIANGSTGNGRIQLAHSRAFEARLRTHTAADEYKGPVLVFSIAPPAARLGEPPHFGQGGATFEPKAADPKQLGRIVRQGAPTQAPTTWLGYVVLPAGFDLTRPLVLFWGDTVEVARLQR